METETDSWYGGLTDRDFMRLETQWLLLNETQSMDLTGAGGPIPLQTRYGTFADWTDIETPDGLVGSAVSDRGVIVLFSASALGTVEEFVYARVVLPYGWTG